MAPLTRTHVSWALCVAALLMVAARGAVAMDGGDDGTGPKNYSDYEFGYSDDTFSSGDEDDDLPPLPPPQSDGDDLPGMSAPGALTLQKLPNVDGRRSAVHPVASEAELLAAASSDMPPPMPAFGHGMGLGKRRGLVRTDASMDLAGMLNNPRKLDFGAATPVYDVPSDAKPAIPAVAFDFDEHTELLAGVDVVVSKLNDDAPVDKDENDVVTPEKIIEMIEGPNGRQFAEDVIGSLIKIYRAKYNLFGVRMEDLAKQVAADMADKKEMSSEIDMSDNQVDKYFPQIVTNQAYRIKIRKLRDEAGKRYTEYTKGQGTDDLIKQTIENLLDAIKNPTMGIQSISGEKRAGVRNELSRMVYMLSRGAEPFLNQFNNIELSGSAGVGKTKAAEVVGYVYSKVGILLNNSIRVLSPKDFIGQYVGETAQKTSSQLMNGLESVVFIDEAYQIMSCNKDGNLEEGKSFGPEAITEIVNFLDKYRGMSVMIVAGYKKQMQNCFFGANEGLDRRFRLRINLTDYTDSDLVGMFVNGVHKQFGEALFADPGLVKYVYTLVHKLRKADAETFKSQAGDVGNLVSSFTTVYRGSINRRWGNGRADQIPMINEMFRDYLQSKGLSVTIGGAGVNDFVSKPAGPGALALGGAGAKGPAASVAAMPPISEELSIPDDVVAPSHISAGGAPDAAAAGAKRNLRAEMPPPPHSPAEVAKAEQNAEADARKLTGGDGPK